MFTGIIENQGRIVSVKKGEKDMVLGLCVPKAWSVKKGDSIAVNGVCLTVAEKKKSSEAYFFCQFETLSVTNLGRLKKGDWVNLERPMKASDRLGGHMVLGHVDLTAVCLEKRVIGEGWQYWLELKKRISGLVLKGSVALDGISLTVSHMKKGAFSVDIIPYTYENTNIRFWGKGTCVNVETDILGKYIENYMKALQK
ncbi:MAG: riboflavin synthase [Candidatus Aureabacteria bacterium]|nr:riboflavin synthase [Candidatus Auribacterota bacterium]